MSLQRRALIVAVIALAFRRSAAHARRGGSRRSTARDICRRGGSCAASSRLARLSSFSSTRWMCRPVCRGKLAGREAEIVQHRRSRRVRRWRCTASSRSPSKRYSRSQYSAFSMAKARTSRHAIVDRAAPWRLRLGEEAGRIAAEIISLGAEVVIDHVEKHHQPAQMRFVDQRLEIVGPAIGAVGRVPQHAVITPVARAGEIRERHQFERGDAGRDQMIELADHGAVGALRA